MLKQQEALSTQLWLATKWFLFCWYYFKNCSLLALALLFTRKGGHLQRLVVMMQHALMRNWSWDTYSLSNIPILSNFTNPQFERICNWLPPRACRLISWLCMWGNWGPGWFLPVCKAALPGSVARLVSSTVNPDPRKFSQTGSWSSTRRGSCIVMLANGQPYISMDWWVCALSTTGIGNN